MDIATLTLSLFIFRSKRRKHAAWYAIQNVLGHCKTDKQYSTSNKHNHVHFISSYDNQLSFIVEPKYLSSCTISYLIYIYGTQLFSCVLISRQGRVFVNIPITSCQAFSAVCIYSIIYADTISVDFSPIDIAYRICGTGDLLLLQRHKVSAPIVFNWRWRKALYGMSTHYMYLEGSSGFTFVYKMYLWSSGVYWVGL